MLHDEVKEHGIHVAHTAIGGRIAPGGDHEPDDVAEVLWRHHTDATRSRPGSGSDEPAPDSHEPDLRLPRPGRRRHRRRLRHGARHRPGLRRSRAPPSCSPTSTSRRLRTATDELTAAGPPGARRHLRRVRRGPGRRPGRAHGRRPSAGSTWRSTTPASRLPPTDAADEPAETFDRVNAINLRGVWACMKHELRQMRAQGSGAIVNCSSLGGLVGLPGPRRLPRLQARRPRPHQERGAGVRAARHPHQRDLPGHDRDPDGRRHDRQGRARHGRRRRQPADRPPRTRPTRSPPPCSGSAAQERAS